MNRQKVKKCKTLSQYHLKALAEFIIAEAGQDIRNGVTQRKRQSPQSVEMIF
jgi:hypothetical protein